jgi:hypothetical protein
MSTLAAILGVIVILIILWDAFETIVLPRRVTGRVRLARLFFRYTWRPWSAIARSLSSGKRHETYLGFYGPLSLLLLLFVWATGLVFGYALLHWANGSAIHTSGGTPGFGMDLYLSATTFFTLGLGDVIPRNPMARLLTAVEAGMGFGFLALLIGYLPALNQSFSRREVSISLLDARAGSPPTAAEMFRRHSDDHGLKELQRLLRDWEVWSAELLESHLSYPVLAYFRSQHENQSWLGSLTVILDTCSLVLAGMEGASARQAELTFAIARHAVVDLSFIFRSPPREPDHDRLPPGDLARMYSNLAEKGLKFPGEKGFEQKLAELRVTYEPFVYSLSRFLQIPIPPWIPESSRADNWQTSAWGWSSGFSKDRKGKAEEEHF